MRVGAAFDGGYGVPERVLKASKGLLSFGLGDDCAFEIEFARAGCPVVCFDPAVDVLFWAARTVSSFAKAILQLEPGQTVLDLGSGGGIDVILSARRVVILNGIDASIRRA